MVTPVEQLVAQAVADGWRVERLQLAPRDVVFFGNLLEGHEGMATVIAAKGGRLNLVYAPSCAPEMQGILEDLGKVVRFARGVGEQSATEGGR